MVGRWTRKDGEGESSQPNLEQGVTDLFQVVLAQKTPKKKKGGCLTSKKCQRKVKNKGSKKTCEGKKGE